MITIRGRRAVCWLIGHKWEHIFFRDTFRCTAWLRCARCGMLFGAKRA